MSSAVLDDQLAAKLRTVSVPTLGHVLEDGFCSPRIRRLTPSAQLVGIAATVRLPDQDALAIDEAVTALRPGEVLCVQLDEARRHAPIGAVTRARLLARGAAGVVVDGPVTDIADLRREENGFVLPVYAAGTSCLTTKRRASGTSVLGGVITIDGVSIKPGDLVVGDENGLLIAPPEVLSAVIDAALASDRAEPALISEITGQAVTITTQDQRDRIVAAVDTAFDHQLAFTQELVRHPSVRANEASAQDLLYRAMAERGLELDRWELDPTELAPHPGAGKIEISYAGLDNVVGTYRPRQEHGRSLILNGHVDVVPEGPEDQWQRSPWDAEIRDGWLYGRGSGDMKAGLVANLFALDAVRAAGLTPLGRIHVQSVVEEESTGNGSLAALLRGYRADAVVIPEPEEDMLVRANVGVVWFRVRVAGHPSHPREMSTGFNAIDAAYVVLGKLRKLEERWNAEKAQHRYFADLDHPINLNVGKINGGDWGSSVPAWCELDVRIALFPGVTPDEAWAEISAVLAAIQNDEAGNPIQATATATGFYAEGYVLEEGSDAEQVLRTSHREAFDGQELGSFTTPGYLDGRVFVQYADIPALVYGPVSEAIHGYDERVNIESVRRITKSIALFIAEWCGVEGVSG